MKKTFEKFIVPALLLRQREYLPTILLQYLHFLDLPIAGCLAMLNTETIFLPPFPFDCLGCLQVDESNRPDMSTLPQITKVSRFSEPK